MDKRTWNERLAEAIQTEMRQSGRSMRAISKAAGMGPNYVGEMLRKGKEPSAQNVIDIAHECKVSLAWIFLGIEMTTEDEKLLTLASLLDDEKKKGLLALLNSDRIGV